MNGSVMLVENWNNLLKDVEFTELYLYTVRNVRKFEKLLLQRYNEKFDNIHNVF